MSKDELRQRFAIPARHQVSEAEFHSKHGGQSEYWVYQEHDEAGALVGTYRYWTRTTICGRHEGNGWEKMDSSGGWA